MNDEPHEPDASPVPRPVDPEHAIPADDDDDDEVPTEMVDAARQEREYPADETDEG